MSIGSSSSLQGVREVEKPTSNGVPIPAPRLSFTQSQAAAAVANQVHSETAIVDQRPPYAVLKAKDDVLNQNGWTYPWSLLEEVKSNQRSLINPCHLMEKRDHQQAQQEKPEDSNALRTINKESDFFEKEDNQPKEIAENPLPMPQNRGKSDLLEKRDDDAREKPEESYVSPPIGEKSDFFEKESDPHAFPPNPDKSDLLVKKDNQSQHLPEDSEVLPQNQHLPEKPQPLLSNPENPDLVFQKDHQPRDKKGEERLTEILKPESQQKQTVLGNTKVEQEDVRETHKTPIKQHITKSLISIKELFQQRKQVEPENNPKVDKCVINGKTFPLINERGYDYKYAAVHCNVWKSIGKPKINKTTANLTSQYKETFPLLGEIKVEIVINNKKSIIPIMVIDNPLSKDKNKAVYIVGFNNK
jgi:hypothetical protein